MCSTCDCDPAPAGGGGRPNLVGPELGVCRRCGAEPFIMLDRVHIECRACFLESCNKKLRSTIGKSRLLNNNDPILVAHSGGAASTALMDLINNSIEFNFRREQKFRPSIVHVDTSSISEPHLGVNERSARLNEFLEKTRLAYPGWALYWTTVEMAARQADCDRSLYLKYEAADSFLRGSEHLFDPESLRATLDALDLTDKQQYLRNSVGSLIARVAESLNSTFVNHGDRFKCIFSASSATQLANNLLVDVILGQGSTIHSTVNICDRRSIVPIVRPMRDFSKKEIAFYLKARNLDHSSRCNPSTLTDRKASIQRITEAFLSKLYVDYPSTYSTLLRTGNKLQDS